MKTHGLSKLWRSDRGLSAVEFALIAPAFCTFIIAITQFGILFFANSGLKSAVAEGARYATIYPKPTNAQIITRITDRKFGMDAANITAPTVTNGTVNGRPYIDISMSYKVTMDFIFFEWPEITLTENRRVFVYP